MQGLPVERGPSLLSREQQDRYSRHLRLAGFTEQHQQKLLSSRVLVLGLGGLGCPAALYLAAAGVGCLGLLDNDRVELSNLQRQILHTTSRIGTLKVRSAQTTLSDLNRDIAIQPLPLRLVPSNINEVLERGWDVIVDGCDNFETRYLVNDAAWRRAIPVVNGSVSGFEGRVATFVRYRGPCYRCLFPSAPAESDAACASCDAAGVLGVLPGTVGLLQATEVIKLLTGFGEPLIGRLLTYDLLAMHFRTLRFEPDPNCKTCGGA